jgi:hypothetical protein
MKGVVMTPAARLKSSIAHKGKPHHISAQGMANINKVRFKIPITAIFKDGSTRDYTSYSEAAKDLNMKAGSVSYYLNAGAGLFSNAGCRFVYKNGI